MQYPPCPLPQCAPPRQGGRSEQLEVGEWDGTTFRWLKRLDVSLTLKTHSRPYTSSDNPYPEAQFKTLKYRPEFPDRFDSIEYARAFCRIAGPRSA
jgi:hypothetical protein